MTNPRSPLRFVQRSALRAVQGIPTPLCFMKLQNDLDLSLGVGVATFTRSTTGTFIDRNTGLVTSAAINIPRFEANGVLIEGASENLLLRSEEFDNAAWTKLQCTISANAATAPDGTITADKIVEDSGAGVSPRADSATATITSGATITGSVFAEADERRYLRLQIFDPAGTNGFFARFDLLTGTVLADTGAAGAGSFSGAEIEELTGGRYRCKVTGSIGAGTSVKATPRLTATDTGFSYTGDGSSGLFAWGAQLEELPFASSYIPTTTIAVTRGADNLSIDAANIPVPTADYSVSLTVTPLGVDDSSSVNGLMNVEGETQRVTRIATSTGFYQFRHNATSQSTTVATANARTKISGTVGATNQTLYVNGEQEDQDAKGTVTGTKTSISIGKIASGNYIFANFKDFRIDSSELSASQAASL